MFIFKYLYIYIYIFIPLQLALDSKLPVIWPPTLSSTYLTARSLTPSRMAQVSIFSEIKRSTCKIPWMD